MHINNKFKKIMAIIIAVLFIIACVLPLSSIFVNAASKSDLEKQMQEKESEKANAKQEIGKIESEKKDVLEVKEQLDSEIGDLETKIGEIEAAIHEDDVKIEEVQQNLDQAQADLNRQYAAFKSRVKVMYEQGSVGYIQALLESESISDFFNRFEVVKMITEYDKNMTDRLEEARNKIEEQKEQLEEIRQQKVEKANELDSQKSVLDQKLAESESYLSQLEDKEAEYVAMINKAEAEQASIRSQIAAMTASVAASGVAIPINYTGGAMLWPLPGYTTANITSQFGGRIHPIYKTSNSHRGIDISAPRGTAIVAANDGVVIRSNYNSSYGYHVMVNHGGGIVTVYAHASALAVSVGQTVTRGQVVAYVGSTGASTGNHLHFEVDVNGTPTNPLGYF